MTSQNGFVNLPHKFKTIYDKWSTAITDAIGEQCESFRESIIGNEHYDIEDFKGACSRVMYYITELKVYYPHDLVSGCKYLYQWVTKGHLSKKEYTEHNLKLYKELLRESCDLQELYDEYKNEIKKISDEIYQKYKFLDDLYSNLIKLQKATGDGCAEAKDFSDLYYEQIKECFSNVNTDFCKELELFRKDYESIMISKDCHDVPKTLTSIYGNNTFTPLNSLLRLQGRRKTRFSNDIDEEINAKLHASRNSRKYSKNGLYNIAYHSN